MVSALFYPRGPQSDMFSFGCLVWELASSCKPWPNLTSAPAPLARFAEEHALPPPLPPVVWGIALRCAAASAPTRPTAEEVVKLLDEATSATTLAVVSLEGFDYQGHKPVAAVQEPSLCVSMPSSAAEKTPLEVGALLAEVRALPCYWPNLSGCCPCLTLSLTAATLLRSRKAAPGTYLIRDSSKPNAFVIVLMSSTQVIQSLFLVSPMGFRLDPESTTGSYYMLPFPRDHQA